MSNEDSALFVIPALKETTKRGGVYVGVGSEQNFTYIAAIQPRLAFVVDIRRDNVFEHLMYKALFELSENRADFVSRLFSRKRPAGIDNAVGVKALFDAYRPVEADAAILRSKPARGTGSPDQGPRISPNRRGPHERHTGNEQLFAMQGRFH